MSPGLQVCLYALTAVGSLAAATAHADAGCWAENRDCWAENPFSALRIECSRALFDFDQAQQIHGDGIAGDPDQPDRARQLFRSAAQRFESIVATGVLNGRLEYNLANCYLQAGDLGRAILHYRRAQRLIPRDPLLADNLSEARSRCLTTIRPARGSTLLRSVFFWHYETSMVSRYKAAIVLYVVFWALLIVRNFVPRRPVTVSVIVAAVLAATSAGSVGAQHWADRRAPEGVITAMDVTVYKGPGTGYQRRFEQPLQPGVEFTLREERPGWWNVELPDGKSGWIDSSAAEPVVALPSESRL